MNKFQKNYKKKMFHNFKLTYTLCFRKKSLYMLITTKIFKWFQTLKKIVQIQQKNWIQLELGPSPNQPKRVRFRLGWDGMG